jgi:hypothetical protein
MRLHAKIALIGHELQAEANRRAGPRGRRVEDRAKLLVRLADEIQKIEARLSWLETEMRG